MEGILQALRIVRRGTNKNFFLATNLLETFPLPWQVYMEEYSPLISVLLK